MQPEPEIKPEEGCPVMKGFETYELDSSSRIASTTEEGCLALKGFETYNANPIKAIATI